MHIIFSDFRELDKFLLNFSLKLALLIARAHLLRKNNYTLDHKENPNEFSKGDDSDATIHGYNTSNLKCDFKKNIKKKNSHINILKYFN